MYNQFFTIKPRISEKNSGSKVVHLIQLYYVLMLRVILRLIVISLYTFINLQFANKINILYRKIAIKFS